jgi:predicted acylesterase/phospholipase RssA
MDATDRYGAPALDCDIVMKGGITSGVVYPGAVLSLAEQYRFRCIGGASAGGIAAAIVAAAEHARADRGFHRLAGLPDELAGTAAGGGPFMLQLFQPDPATRPLFAALIGLLERKWGDVLRAFWRAPSAALVLAVLFAGLGLFGGLAAVLAVVGVFVAVVVLVVGLALDVKRVVGRLPANDFGLCRLGPGAGSPSAPALTGWLHQRIQSTAGRTPEAPPLTFADLWAGPGETLPTAEHPDARLDRLLALSRDPSARAVDLQMMTTDLTHGRPLRLPSPYQQHKRILEDGGTLLFDPDELRRFFPGDVVDHLVAYAPPGSEETAAHLERLGAPQLRRFPIGPDLPVVVATRMTLSFPVLISAIPLYEIDYRRAVDPPLVRVLFSDGGITSNFPVHFFDSPLPRRPTFGLDLVGVEPGDGFDPAVPSTGVRDPAAVNATAYRAVRHITGLGPFFTAIKDAMQNWRDNAQSELPGFRDRVVHLKLDKGEGGLNLTMDAGKIRELNDRGTYAGGRLLALFAGDGTAPTEHWNGHRWVRYRTTMSLLDRTLRSFQRGYDEPADAVTIPYPQRIAAGDEPPYRFPQGSLAIAQHTTLGYLTLVAGWKRDGTTLDDAGVPRPPATLRAVPPV